MRLARRAAYGVIRRMPVVARRIFLDYELSACRARLVRKFIDEFGSVVQAGPFGGMEILAEYSWGDGHLLPKLLGSYESELHKWISKVLKRGYRTVLDVGCAEGYYTVGLARASPKARVIGSDISSEARRICRDNADRNGVSDRVELAGYVGPESMAEMLSAEGPSFVLLDCEGAEVDLLLPELIARMRNTDILIECHDFLDRGLTNTLYRRLLPTHSIERVDEGPRDPSQFSFLNSFSGFERMVAVCEFRREPMHWLFCTSRCSSPE